MTVTVMPVKRLAELPRGPKEYIIRNMRIASLLASATEIVYELGLSHQLVAISHECDYPPEALQKPRLSRPRFDPTGLTSGGIDAAVRELMAHDSSVYEIDTELLLALEPDLILAQAVCEVCAVPTSLAETVSQLMGRRPRILSLDAHTLGDILDAVVMVGDAAGAAQRGRSVAAGLRARMAAVQARVERSPRPRGRLSRSRVADPGVGGAVGCRPGCPAHHALRLRAGPVPGRRRPPGGSPARDRPTGGRVGTGLRRGRVVLLQPLGPTRGGGSRDPGGAVASRPVLGRGLGE